MAFSQEWDERFRQGRNISRWPWSDVVSYVYRHARPLSDFRRVLEIGCAAGPNIPFFLDLDMDYDAIEGSETIVAQVLERFPQLAGRVVAGDFTERIPFDGPFDLILDRSSLTHNSTDAIRRTLAMCFDRLRPGGKYIGIDWFSAVYPESRLGTEIDIHTRTALPEGQFAGVGAIHFSDRAHLEGLLAGAGFSIERLEHKTIDTVAPEGVAPVGWWNFVAVKS